MANRTVVIQVKPELLVFLACSFLVIPVRWVFAWILASVVHELSHYIAIKCMGGRVFRLQIGLPGAQMETETLTPFQEILSALAGPVGGLSLVFISKWFPEATICGFFHSAYNLLPLFPMDGGRVFRGLLGLWFLPSTTCRIEKYIRISVFAVLLFLAVYYSIVMHLGILPILFTIILYFRCRN